MMLMRAATNTVINHPRTGKSSSGIAIFETFMLCLAWTATLVGMIACGLGYEPKTGWAVFGVTIMAIVGYATCYFFQTQEDDEKAAKERYAASMQGTIQ
jgi:4-hydroxybenzoate polyprenyltransferase